MSDTPEFPFGVFPVYNGDDLATIVTGLFSGRIQRAEEAGLFGTGTSDIFLDEVDNAATEEERTTVQHRWDEEYSTLVKEITELAVADVMNRAKDTLGDDDFEIPDES